MERFDTNKYLEKFKQGEDRARGRLMAEKQCPICFQWFKSLRYARHRAMHYDRKIKKEAEE